MWVAPRVNLVPQNSNFEGLYLSQGFFANPNLERLVKMNKYRTHHCGALRKDHMGQRIRLAGWVDTIRDHGGIAFIDLRDHYGITQIVIHEEKLLQGLGKEFVISVEGIFTRIAGIETV